MKTNSHSLHRKNRLVAGGQLIKVGAVIAITAIATVGGLALLINIMEHKQEAKNPFFKVVELTDDTDDPAIWGKNFPLQYDGYKRTVDMTRTKYGGSEAMPRTPTTNDPRTIVSQSKIEEDPRLKKMWAGYAFAIDFREERGHAYMLEDQTFTERQKKAQPGTCLNCHASMYNAYKKAGNGDIVKGFEAIKPLPYAEARKLVTHPVACIDCHDSQTMALRITRPAFMEGMKALKASQGIADYDVNRDATRQEMRSFVCGQCHDEYYFKGKEKRLTFPWHKGQKADQILAYYDEVGFSDWTHADTGAPMLKAQHPEFEMWNQGIHARSGVACADCHMPYQRVGAQKIWAGTVHIHPDAKTGAHHHGHLESVIYVVRGRARMRWGERLEFVAEAGPGDFIYVPPYVPHQEINASPDQPLECVLVRSDNEAVVVNLDIEPVEKPEAVHWVDPVHPPPRA